MLITNEINERRSIIVIKRINIRENSIIFKNRRIL
jgi:hypothetical protein